MKHLKQGILGLLCLFLYGVVSAQKVLQPREPVKKTKIFQDLPDRVPVMASGFLPLLRLKTGEAARVSLSDKVAFDGTIISTASKYNNTIKSVVLKLTSRGGANLSFSEITHPDGSISYTGRIISFQHGDCYELKKENGEYIMIKKNFEDMVND